MDEWYVIPTSFKEDADFDSPNCREITDSCRGISCAHCIFQTYFKWKQLAHIEPLLSIIVAHKLRR